MAAEHAEDREVDFHWVMANPLRHNLWRFPQDEWIVLNGPDDDRTVELEVFRLTDLNFVPAAHAHRVSEFLRARGCFVGRAVVTFEEYGMIRRTPLTRHWKMMVANSYRPVYGCVFRRLIGVPPAVAEDGAPPVPDAADSGYPEDSQMDA